MNVSNAAGSATAREGYYVWTAAEGSLAVHLRLDVIDRMLPQVMAGFGAVPRRGAEVGGVLLGAVEPGEITIIRIDGFEAVPCSYKRGPSFLLCELDMPKFEAVASGERAGDSSVRPVGYFRSHTRDVQALDEDDRTLCDRFFPAPNGIALLIRPYATRTSTAGFVTYENGQLLEWPRHEFPFRRDELAPDDSVPRPARRPLGMGRATGQPGATRRQAELIPEPVQHPPVSAESPRLSRGRRDVWTSLQLSLLLICAGLVLGYVLSRMPASGQDPYAVALSAVARHGDLEVRWDRDSVATRMAQHATLQIDDGAGSRIVDLNGAELRSGSVALHVSSRPVALRLELFLNGRTSVVQSLNWKP